MIPIKRRDDGASLSFPRLLALFLLCAVTVFFNLATGRVTALGEAYYLAGSLFYLLFLKLVRMDRAVPVDYLQSGEGWMGLAVLILSAVFISGHAGVLFAVSLIAFIGPGHFLHLIAKGSRREQLVIGAIAAFVFLLIFLHLVSLGFEAGRLGVFFFGYIHAVRAVWWPLLILPVLYAGLYFLYRKSIPELALYSHGAEYFAAAGKGYRYLRAGAVTVRGAFLAVVFVLAGVLPGAGAFLLAWRERHRRSADLESFFLVFFAVNCFLLLARYLTELAVGGIAVAVSYAAYIFFSPRRAHD